MNGAKMDHQRPSWQTQLWPARAPAVHIALLLLSGCVTASNDTPTAALRGCWIAHESNRTVSMRWFPEPDGASWRGEQLVYRTGAEPEHQTFVITESIWISGTRTGSGWDLCAPEDDEDASPRCWTLSGGEQGYQPHNAKIHVADEQLRIVASDEGQETVLFDGARDGCDQTLARFPGAR